MRSLRRLSPHDTLSGQIILLVIGVLLLTQILNVAFLLGERKAMVRDTHYSLLMDRMVTESENLSEIAKTPLPMTVLDDRSFRGIIFLSNDSRAAEPSRKMDPKAALTLEARLKAAGLSPLRVEVSTVPRERGGRPDTAGMGQPQTRPSRPQNEGSLDSRQPDRRSGDIDFSQARPPSGRGSALGLEEVAMSAELAPGVWLNMIAPYYNSSAVTRRAMWLTLLSLAVGSVAAMLMARRILRPIRALRQAATRLARGDTVPLIPETGPVDIRTTAHAFNAMQAQLTKQIAEQRSTLRAVGHDLRTPLTSLRLRAEEVPDAAGRDKIIAGLDHMSAMTEEILNWSRLTDQHEEFALTDIASLLDSIAQDYADTGRPVEFRPSDTVSILVRRNALRRAVSNLVDNAVSYADCAELSLAVDGGEVNIIVEDNGPGIPPDELERMQQPFQRKEGSRNRNTGGIGLGLSIVRSLVQGQGGAFRIENRPDGPKGHGLRAVITLPVGLQQS